MEMKILYYRIQFWKQLDYLSLVFSSLTYNHHLKTTPGYISDMLMEPIFYIVDHYAYLLGPVIIIIKFSVK